MIPISFSVSSKSEVELPEFSSAFADMDSHNQAIIMMDFFDALEHKCKDSFSYENKLHFIATSINENNFKRLKYTIETLHEFTKGEQ